MAERSAGRAGPLPVRYVLDKDKLARGESYPLQRSVLDAELHAQGIQKLHVVYYMRPRDSSVLEARYTSTDKKGWAAAGRTSLTVHAVRSSQRAVVSREIVEVGLPAMLRWVRELEQAGNVRRACDHCLQVTWDGSRLAIHAT